MKLSLVIQTPEVEAHFPFALLSGSFEEKLEKAAGFGAQGVELLSVDPRSLKVESIHMLLQKNGLEASAIASGGLGMALGVNLLNPDPEKAALAKHRLVDLIDFATAVGAPVVTVGGLRGRLGWAEGPGREILIAILREISDYAGKKNIRLALEPLNRYETDFIYNVKEGLVFIEEVAQPSLGLLVDTFHVNIEESSWTQPFRHALAAGKLFHVHLGDNNRLPPGDGLIDFRAIVVTLREGGYTGFMSAELLPRPDPDTAAQRTLAYMQSILGK
jgi:sugar phosphate isomerase/epimerase